jgi:hypothetical protein
MAMVMKTNSWKLTRPMITRARPKRAEIGMMTRSFDPPVASS